MQEEQLYAGGRPFLPKTDSDNIPVRDVYGLTGGREATVQGIIDAIACRIVERLLEKTEVADWAKQREKPSYTAWEVGADGAGSADAALAAAKEYSDGVYAQAAGYVDLKIAELVNGAPETLDTLREIADAMADNEGVVGALEAAIGNKASEAELQAHASNGNVHITRSEREGLHSAVEKLKGVEEGANRVTLTKSLAATEEGTGLDAVVGPIIMQRMDSLNSNLTNSLNGFKIYSDISHLGLSSTASLMDVCRAMADPSMAVLRIGTDPLYGSPTNWSVMEVVRTHTNVVVKVQPFATNLRGRLYLNCGSVNELFGWYRVATEPV